MCGICGVHVPNGPLPDPGGLAAMNAALAHRGPDGAGVRTFSLGPSNTALMHRRLSIIDLAGGDQPLFNEDGTVWIVFNGEIYNFQALRRDLEAKGHVFATNSDTEVIVHLYEDHGPACVDFLRGMFALALYDAKDGTLFLARDRLGKKPLYYAEVNGALVFASEIKSILTHPDFDRRVDLEAINHYLTLQYVPDPMTAFAGIRSLPPGHRMSVGTGEFRPERYWTLSYEPKHAASEEDLAEELRERLTEAVRLRLVSDVPLGAHLSGGIDSSIITALMASMTDAPVKTFSIGFREAAFSETAKARAVAERYGTDHHEFVVGWAEALDMMETAGLQFDQPFADPSALAVWFLSRMTREHVTVALNGDGGDELFGGYQRYWLDPLANAYAGLPAVITQKLVPGLLAMVPESGDRPIEKNWTAGAKRLAQAAAISPKASIVRWGSYFSPAMKRALLREEVRMQIAGLDTPGLLSRLFDAAEAETFLDRTLAADVGAYLPGDLLVKADRMTMAHSLEGRSPLLDHELAEWAARLPTRCKMRGRNGKHLLRRAFAHLLPSEVMDQKKQGFGLPVGKWFRNELRDCARDTLLAGGITDYVRTSEVERLLDEHERGRVDHGKRIYALVMLANWLNAFS